jgi:hypothetical protein
MRDVVADYKRGQQDIADASSFDRTFQEAEQPPATLSEMLGQPIVDFGKWLGNITTAGVSQFTGTREADPYVNTGPPRFGPDGEGPPGLGDYVDPAQQDTGADPPGIEDTDYQGPAKTDEDGWVLYKGKRIRPDMFLDYLYSQNQEPFELDENGIPTSPYWAKQVFVQGSKKTLESMGWAEYLDNRDMLPNTVTAAQLDLLGPNSKYTDEYMRDVLNYRWDPELGAWIKQEETAGTPGDGGGGGSGYGYGGGGYGGGYTEKKYPRSGQYLRGGTGVEPIQDRGYVQPGRGIAPVHWRF